ncbi:MAG TPA: MFS transporter [Burkholderiales bacterium]|nr:MFS transporter [Burkholderiales bacterium]
MDISQGVSTAARAATRWPAVFAAIFAGVVGACAFGKMSPALPLLKEEFGLTLIQSGWLVSSFNAIAATGAIAFGVFADRIGALRFCVAGVLAIGAASALGAFVHGAGWLIASRLVEGLGFLAVVVSAPGLIAAATAPDRRGVAFGLWSTYLPLGVSLVVASSPLLLPGFGWRGVWVLVGIAAAACAALLLSQSRSYAGSAGGHRSLASLRQSLAQPVPWLLGLAFAAYAIQHMALIVWLPTYLLDTRGLAGAVAALLTALAVFANCFGNVLGGWLIQHDIPRGRIIAATFAVTSLAFVGIFSSGLPDALRYALAVFYSFITGMVPAAALSAGMRYARSPAEFGSIQGLIVNVTHIGIFFGPPLVAASVTYGGSWDAALWVMLGCAAVGLASAAAIGRYERGADRLPKGKQP